MTYKVRVTIDSVGTANTSKKRTATYSKGNGVPDWVTLNTPADGDINLTGAPANNLPAVEIIWTLPSGYLFHGTTPFSPADGDFSVVSGAGTDTLTVSDSNNDPTTMTYEYTLFLNDDTSIDPKVINR